jgi:hypothetical protein
MFCSLKLAVLVILALAISLGTATFVESLKDTPTAQFWVYQAPWFHGILALLGVNILCVAMSRYPWQRKHIPFLLAHAGILILLAGSWMTQKLGLDGNLRVSEGEVASLVELDTSSLLFSERDRVFSIPIPWLPVGVNFKPFEVASRGVPYDIRVDQFLTHADPVISFIPNPSQKQTRTSSEKKSAAVRLKLVGGAMGISQDIWLWEGSPNWKSLQAGPSFFALGEEISGKPGQPSLSLRPEKDGSLSYTALSSAGKTVKGRFKKDKIIGQVIHPGWKGNLTITIAEWVSDAVASTTYKPARVQYGSQAPSSAIHVVAGQRTDLWLGLGDRAVFHLDQQDVEIAYYPKRVVLPFSLKLEQFAIEHDPGTLTPASYSSRVSVLDGDGQKEALISMNEPLQMRGYTIYQASYEDGDPRPVTSIFAVNQDPGRPWKYLGSALIVLGSVLLFAAKYRRARTAKKVQVKSGVLVTSVSEG